MDELNTAKDKAIAGAGSIRKLARRTGIPEAQVKKWRLVPHKFLLRVEAASGVPRQELRPDLYAGLDDAAYNSVTQAELVTWARETFGGNDVQG